MKTEIKKELNRTKFRVIVDGLYKEDYQIRMLRENAVAGLLPMNARGEGEETIYEYDVTGLLSLEELYRKRKITAHEMLNFLEQIQKVFRETEQYLLNPNRLLLNPAYIFCEEERCSFCYFPQGEGEIHASFHQLMENFVAWTDEQDIGSMKAAFLLHKETLGANYSIRRIADKLGTVIREAQELPAIGTESGEETEPAYAEPSGREGYDDLEHDWILKQEAGSKIMKETDNLWSPMKRFLYRHRRPKWGEWDGVYVDEEDFR